MNIITHRIDNYNVQEELEKVKARILSGPEPDKKIKVFNQLCEFEYGRWMLINQGLNAYWANYLIYHDEIRKEKMIKEPMHSLEKTILNSPGVLSSKDRAKRNSTILQKLIKDNMTVASIPCAAMNDLLRLNLNGMDNIKLVGIDLDSAAIDLAKENSVKFKKETFCTFKLADAFDLNIENEFDVLHSTGLNMYAKTESELLKLYTNFYKAVKPGGYLVVTSNVAPKDENGSFTWSVGLMEMASLPEQVLIFFDVIQIRQGMYCTKDQIISQLKTVGFTDIQVDFDSRKMFLCFTAKK
jgi:SAM-dependent methyltransferase